MKTPLKSVNFGQGETDKNSRMKYVSEKKKEDQFQELVCCVKLQLKNISLVVPLATMKY